MDSFNEAVVACEKILQIAEGKDDIEILFSEDDHRGLIIFEVFEGLNSLREYFQNIRDKNSVKRIEEMEYLLSQISIDDFE